MFRDQAHLLKLLKQQSGVYNVVLNMTDEELYKDVVVDTTLMCFCGYMPRTAVLKVDLNQLRIPDDPDSTDSSTSNIYRVPIEMLGDDRLVLGVVAIEPYNDSRYLQLPTSPATLETFQGLCLTQAIADLSSTIEPPLIPIFMPPNRVKIENGTFYQNRCTMTIEYTYSTTLSDLPLGKRQAFFKLALLDFKEYLYNNLKYEDESETAIARLDLKLADWQSATDEKKSLLEDMDSKYHLNRRSVIFF